MRGHLISLCAALTFIGILVRLPPQGAGGSRSEGHVPPAGSADLRQEIAQRRRDVMLLYRAAQRIPGADPRPRGALTCGDLARLSGIAYVGSGFTKLVLKGTLPGGKEIALKTVHGGGSDVRSCVQAYAHRAGCHRLATYKLEKEMALMEILRHPGIVQLHGRCYVNSEPGDIRVTAMLDLGSPLEMIQLLQAPWEERFKVCLELVRLLHYLADSPLGSVALLDFQPRQFVVVDGSLKLTDLDDATGEEIRCREDADCTLAFPARSFAVACSAAGTCHGANEKRNLYNAYRFFFTYLLPHASPPDLRPLLQDIMNATGDLRLGIRHTLEAFEAVLSFYKSGMNQSRTSHLTEYSALKGFRVNETSDDFRCWPSYDHRGCRLSVLNAAEAAEFCSGRSRCRSFTMSRHRTWTGRYLATFTSSESRLILEEGSSVYVKRNRNSGGRHVQNIQEG